MEQDKDNKDQSLPCDPKKSMIHRWCSSSDDFTSSESIPSVTDVGSPFDSALLGFSPGTFSVKSPDLLLLKSPPSVSLSWLKSPHSVSDLPSGSGPVSISNQDKSEAQQEGTEPDKGVSGDVDGAKGSEGLASASRKEEVMTSARDMDASIKCVTPSRQAVKLSSRHPNEETDSKDKELSGDDATLVSGLPQSEKLRKLDEAEKNSPASFVTQDLTAVSVPQELNYSPGLFSPTIRHHSLPLSNDSAKESQLLPDSVRYDSYPLSLQSVSDLSFMPSRHVLSDSRRSQSQSLRELSHWDQFPMTLLSQASGSSPKGLMTQPLSGKRQPDRESPELSSGEQPSKSKRTSYPSSGFYASCSASSTITHSDSGLRNKPDLLFGPGVTSTILGGAETGLQLHSITSSTHPSMSNVEKKIQSQAMDQHPLVVSSLEAYKPFQSQTFQLHSQLPESQDGSQKDAAAIKSGNICNPDKKSHLGNWTQPGADVNIDFSGPTHSPEYSLCRVSLIEVRPPPDDVDSSEGTQEMKKTVGMMKDAVDSRDAKSFPSSVGKHDVSGEVVQLDICDNQVDGRSSADTTKTDKQVCQVCGDLSASFHCGANVCEACKKFFVRCIRQEGGVKFVCHRKQHCEVTKETRTQCQYCRFQKCVSLGMYKPGGSNISSEIGHIPCKVCNAPSSGYHFGAITCEGCKGFFRRTIKERDHMKYRCGKGGSCVITMTTRNMCKYCRYQKCLSVGMTPTGSRIGRQPNAVRHATLMQLQQIKTMKGLPPDPHLPQPAGAPDVKQEPQMDEVYGGEEEEHVVEEIKVGMSQDMTNICEADITKDNDALCSHMPSPPEKPWSQTQLPSDGSTMNPEIGVKSGGLPTQRKQSLAEMDPRFDCPDYPKSMSSSLESMPPKAVKVADNANNQSAYTLQQAAFISPHQASVYPESIPDTALASSSLGLPPPMAAADRQISMDMNSSKTTAAFYPPHISAKSLPPSDNNPGQNGPISVETDASVPSGSDISPSIVNMPTAPPSDKSAAEVNNAYKGQSDSTVRKKDSVHSGSSTTTTTSPASTEATKNPPKMEIDFVAATKEFILKGPEELKKIRDRSCSRIEASMTCKEVWTAMMSQFQSSAHVTLRFAKKVPGFRNQPIVQQIEAIKQNMFPIVIIQLSLDYDINTSKYNYFSLDEEEEKIILSYFPPFRLLIPLFHEIGRKVTSLKLSEVEVSFLCGLILVCDAQDGSMVENLTNSLQQYIKEHNQGQCCNKFGQILLMLADFKKLSEIHQKAIWEIVSNLDKYPGIEIPQLFQETFLSDL